MFLGSFSSNSVSLWADLGFSLGGGEGGGGGGGGGGLEGTF